MKLKLILAFFCAASLNLSYGTTYSEMSDTMKKNTANLSVIKLPKTMPQISTKPPEGFMWMQDEKGSTVLHKKLINNIFEEQKKLSKTDLKNVSKLSQEIESPKPLSLSSSPTRKEYFFTEKMITNPLEREAANKRFFEYQESTIWNLKNKGIPSDIIADSFLLKVEKVEKVTNLY